MPGALTTFVGRSRELSELEAAVRRSRLVTLIGPGGVGKTRIAVELAGRLEPDFSDRVAVVDLASITQPGLLSQLVASAVGVQESLGIGLMPALLDALSRRQLLLLLDNCEHLVAAAAALGTTMLQTCPQLKLLATSREPLGVQGETIRQVLPMAVDDAAALFGERLLEATAAYQPSSVRLELVKQLCERLDCIPLAIELAAGRARVLTIEQMLERLDDRFRLLESASSTAPQRHQTLERTIEWSYELLTPEERSLWCQVSVFAARFDLEAAECVARVGEQGNLQLLARLADRSLVQVEHVGPAASYRLLESIREYGRSHLRPEQAEIEVLCRFRDCYLDRALQAESAWRGPHQAEWLARVEADLPNFRAALQFSLGDYPETALRMASGLWFFWYVSGRLSEGRRWLEAGLAAWPERDGTRACGLNDAGFLAYCQGDSDAALPLLEASLQLGHELGDEQVIAFATTRLGIGALFHGDLPRAARLLDEALASYRSLGDVVGIYLAGYELAEALFRLGNYDRSAERYEESLAVKRRQGDRWHIAFSLFGLGQLARERGDLARAGELLRESLEIRIALGDHIGTANSIEAIAWVATSQKDYRLAARLMGSTTRLLERIGAKLPPHLVRSRRECEALLVKQLGSKGFAHALAEGAQLDAEEAILLAMGGTFTARKPGGLTSRELAVARLVARGLANKEIAAQLSISERTAESHVEHIRNKLGFHSRSQIAAWAAHSEVGTESR